MRTPAGTNGGRDDSFGRNIARNLDLEAIRRLLHRERFTPEEIQALGWANLAATHSSVRGLTDEEYDLLTRLEATINNGGADLTGYQTSRARDLIQAAFDGDTEARIRMLRYAREIDSANAE